MDAVLPHVQRENRLVDICWVEYSTLGWTPSSQRSDSIEAVRAVLLNGIEATVYARVRRAGTVSPIRPTNGKGVSRVSPESRYESSMPDYRVTS